MERIGKYRIIAKLGQGGMARVLLVMPDGMPGFQKLLVIKELKQELTEDGEFLAMFLDEARLAARLNHPNIVQSYEVGQDGDRHFIAMEYLEGQPLNAVLRRVGRANFSLEIYLKVLVDVLSALEHAHELSDFDGSPLNVVHRDVSPQNVFVTFDGHVKLVDFGIAKVSGASTTTRQGVIKGKISYIAPEQASGDPIDARCDVFAVGVMLWEALARMRISRREDEMTILARRIAGNDPKVRDVAPDVPKALGDICDKAMALDPVERYQTARDFREALEDYMRVRGWHVGPRDVGRVVTGAFAEERKEIREIIEARVEADQTRSGPISLDLHPERLLATSQSLPAVRLASQVSESTHPSTPPPTQDTSTQLSQSVTTPPPPGRSVVPLVALAIVSIAAGVALFAFRGGDEAAPTPAASAPDEEDKTVRLSVHYPEGARLELDGGRVEGNPFVASVPKDGSVHKIAVVQDGFVTDTRTVLFDRDHELTFELEPQPKPAAVEPKEAEPDDDEKKEPEPKVVILRQREQKKPDPEPEAAPPPPPKPTGANPSQPGVQIDESNPYRK